MGSSLPVFLEDTNEDPPALNSQSFEPTRALAKKYVAVHEFTIYGDPAFNPYQTMN
jgi:hypothetical protein